MSYLLYTLMMIAALVCLIIYINDDRSTSMSYLLYTLMMVAALVCLIYYIH